MRRPPALRNCSAQPISRLLYVTGKSPMGHFGTASIYQDFINFRSSLTSGNQMLLQEQRLTPRIFEA